MTIIEEVGPATRMVTVRCKDAIYYGVEHLEMDFLGKPEWVTVWSHTVPFRRDKAHRAGGYAFLDAAKMQKESAIGMSVIHPSTPEEGQA